MRLWTPQHPGHKGDGLTVLCFVAIRTLVVYELQDLFITQLLHNIPDGLAYMTVLWVEPGHLSLQLIEILDGKALLRRVALLDLRLKYFAPRHALPFTPSPGLIDYYTSSFAEVYTGESGIQDGYGCRTIDIWGVFWHPCSANTN